MGFQQLQVVFLDAVGTLFHLPKGVGFHYASVAARHGWTLAPSQLDAAFRLAWKCAPPKSTQPGPRPDDDRGWWRELVFAVLAECDVEPHPPAREAFFAELYDEFALPGVWALYPEVPEVIDRLADRFELGVISNFDGRLRRLLGQFGLLKHFRHIVISSEVGADKPDGAIFDAALAMAGVSAAAALHVGDDPELDWNGAARAGLQVFRLDRPRNSLRDLLEALSISDPTGS